MTLDVGFRWGAAEFLHIPLNKGQIAPLGFCEPDFLGTCRLRLSPLGSGSSPQKCRGRQKPSRGVISLRRLTQQERCKPCKSVNWEKVIWKSPPSASAAWA